MNCILWKYKNDPGIREISICILIKVFFYSIYKYTEEPPFSQKPVFFYSLFMISFCTMCRSVIRYACLDSCFKITCCCFRSCEQKNPKDLDKICNQISYVSEQNYFFINLLINWSNQQNISFSHPYAETLTLCNRRFSSFSISLFILCGLVTLMSICFCIVISGSSSSV